MLFVLQFATQNKEQMSWKGRCQEDQEERTLFPSCPVYFCPLSLSHRARLTNLHCCVRPPQSLWQWWPSEYCWMYQCTVASSSSKTGTLNTALYELYPLMENRIFPSNLWFRQRTCYWSETNSYSFHICSWCHLKNSLINWTNLMPFCGHWNQFTPQPKVQS